MAISGTSDNFWPPGFQPRDQIDEHLPGASFMIKNWSCETSLDDVNSLVKQINHLEH